MKTDEVVTEDKMMAETKSSACKPSVEERLRPRSRLGPMCGCGERMWLAPMLRFRAREWNRAKSTRGRLECGISDARTIVNVSPECAAGMREIWLTSWGWTLGGKPRAGTTRGGHGGLGAFIHTASTSVKNTPLSSALAALT